MSHQDSAEVISVYQVWVSHLQPGNHKYRVALGLGVEIWIQWCQCGDPSVRDFRFGID
jgi:hypothetical protein